MSQAGSQAAAFYREVAQSGRVWTLRDDRGYPTVTTPEGKPAMPFWSSQKRATRIAKTVRAYAQMQAADIAWPEFRDRWLPGLERDGIQVGVNWTGQRAVGFDLPPATVRQAVEYAMNK